MRMAFEDELRKRAKQLPVLDAGHTDFDAMERKWATSRTIRQRRRRRFMAVGSIVAAVCVAVGIGVARPNGPWAEFVGEASHTGAAYSSNQFNLSFIPLTASTPISLQHVDSSAQTSRYFVDLLIGRWPHPVSSNIAIFATSTVSNATVGVALAPEGTPSISADSHTVPKTFQDVVNAHIHQLHLSKVDGSAILIHGAVSSNEIYNRIPVVVYANKKVPANSLRFVITDLVPNKKGGLKPKWISVTMPSAGSSIDDTVLTKLPIDVANLRIPWSKTVGKYTYRIYTYQSGGEKYVRYLTAQQLSGGTSTIVYGGSGNLPAATNSLYKNVYPFSWSGTLPNNDGRYLALGGIVNNPQIATVQLKFIDGFSTTVPVQNGVYAYVRTWPSEKGTSAGLASTKGYTKSGRLVFSR